MKQKPVFSWLSRYAILIAFLALIVIMAILSPAFLKLTNIMNILRQTSINGIVAVGMTFVIILAGIDLSAVQCWPLPLWWPLHSRIRVLTL